MQACNILMINGKDGVITTYEEDTIKKFEGYDLSLKVLIKNVVECNNGEVDTNNFKVDRDYPKCYFGLSYGDYVDVSEE